MSKTYPEREQRHHTDIFAGMTFYFVQNPNVRPGDKPLFTDPDEEWSRDCAWTVIAKEFIVKMSGGYWQYLLLGPGPTLKWHIGQLGWIRRVADPVWEERDSNGWGTTLSRV